MGAWVGAPPADLQQLLPFIDGSALAGAVGYLLNSLIAAYPESEPTIRAALTPRGTQMLDNTVNQCVVQTLADYTFRHLQGWFVTDPYELLAAEPYKTLLDEQKLGRLRPSAPVFIDQNRWDPVVPWVGSRQLAVDWCSRGAGVEFFTNDQPPFLNKLVVNHALAALVDGERGMQWIADRFNGLPAAPNCASL